MNFKNISKSRCHIYKVGQNNWQRMGLLIFILQLKKKIRGHERLIHTFTKVIRDKTSQNNNNKKIDGKKQLRRRDKKQQHQHKFQKIKKIKNILPPCPNLEQGNQN